MISRRFVDSYKCITILSTSLDALLWKFTSHIRQLSPWAPFSERLSDFVSAFSHADFQFSSVQFSFGCFFPMYILWWLQRTPPPLLLHLSAVLLLVDMWCECKCGSGSVCGTYIMRLSLSARLRFKWEREWALFFLLLLLLFFLFFSDAHWNATTSRHQQARERGRGERETGQVSTVVEVSYSFDCLPNCRVSSHKPSLCAYSSSLSPTLSHAWDITYNCV